MATPRYSRVDAPASSENDVELFNRLSGFTEPNLNLDIGTSPDNNVRQQSVGAARRQDSMNSPEPVLPAYRDYSQEPIPLFVDGHRAATNKSSRSFGSIGSKLRDFGVSNFTVPRLASPWDHELVKEAEGTPPTYHTIRQYDHRRQRRRLFTSSIFQWLVTVFICGAMAGTLYGFSTIQGLYPSQKHAFNALITGLSIALSINLASSLRSYAQMMRWRILASGYWKIQEFELLMQADRQFKILRLLVANRLKGRILPTPIQMFCLLWIFINVGCQVLVALLGLFYSIDVSPTWVLTQYGNTSVADLSIIHDVNNVTSVSNVLQQQSAANFFGIQGQDYLLNYDIPNDSSSQTELNGIYSDDNMNYWEYRFSDENPLNLQVNIVTDRTINSTAICQQYRVTFADVNSTSITYLDSNGQSVSRYIQPISPGATTYMSNTQSNCGPRCSEVNAFQLADNISILDSSFFKCNCTVWPVLDASSGEPVIAQAPFQLPDLQAQILAGAVAWSGFGTVNDTWEYIRYSEASYYSPSDTLTPSLAQELISVFSIKAIAAMDDHGPRINITTDSDPVQAEVVDVHWTSAIAILAVIPALQLLTLMIIIAFANKAIIKDNSFLGAARLLRPLVERLGPHGCLLNGDEIATELQNVKITYGIRSPPGWVDGSNMVRHVDVLFEHEGLGLTRAMQPGRYDGEATPEVGPEGLKRRLAARRLSI